MPNYLGQSHQQTARISRWRKCASSAQEAWSATFKNFFRTCWFLTKNMLIPPCSCILSSMRWVKRSPSEMKWTPPSIFSTCSRESRRASTKFQTKMPLPPKASKIHKRRLIALFQWTKTHFSNLIWTTRAKSKLYRSNPNNSTNTKIQSVKISSASKPWSPN